MAYQVNDLKLPLRTPFSDVEKIRDGLSDKVGMCIQWIASFLSGFVIAFVYEWRLSLVILATSPLLAIAGYAFSKVDRFFLFSVR